MLLADTAPPADYLIVRNSGNDGLVFSGLLNADLNISILPGDKGLSWNVEDGLTVTAWRIEADSAGSLGPFLAAVRRGVLPPDTKDVRLPLLCMRAADPLCLFMNFRMTSSTL